MIEEEGHGPVYKAIEKALWAFAPVPALLLLLSYPSMQAARQQAEMDVAKEIAAETTDYCTKWRMPPGSAHYENCLRDLVGIRARAEQRVRDEVARDISF